MKPQPLLGEMIKDCFLTLLGVVFQPKMWFKSWIRSTQKMFEKIMMAATRWTMAPESCGEEIGNLHFIWRMCTYLRSKGGGKQNSPSSWKPTSTPVCVPLYTCQLLKQRRTDMQDDVWWFYQLYYNNWWYYQLYYHYPLTLLLLLYTVGPCWKNFPYCFTIRKKKLSQMLPPSITGYSFGVSYNRST